MLSRNCDDVVTYPGDDDEPGDDQKSLAGTDRNLSTKATATRDGQRVRHTLSMIMESINLSLSTASTLTRLWVGWRGRPAHAAPDRPIKLYEFEGCPFCRIAREAVSALQLSADVRPCPRGGVRFRAELDKTGGKAQFPCMIDPNTGVRVYESAQIARYLYTTYGKRRAPARLWPIVGKLNVLWSALSSVPRFPNGHFSYGRKHAVAEPLEFWGVEADPCARLVRETLCSLEIPYRLHTQARRDGVKLTLFDGPERSISMKIACRLGLQRRSRNGLDVVG